MCWRPLVLDQTRAFIDRSTGRHLECIGNNSIGFDKPDYNMLAAIREYCSWGYFDPGQSNYVDGYQCPPVNWGINTDRKRQFFAKVLEGYGYVSPTSSHVNVTSDGIEIDVAVSHKLTNRLAIAECKAYANNVAAKELTSFYGKLGAQRLTSDSGCDGFFVSLPRLTAQGEEQARAIAERDKSFFYLNSNDIVEKISSLGIIKSFQEVLGEELVSDHAIIVTEQGVFSACKGVDPVTRRAVSVKVWSVKGVLPDPARSIIASSDYADSLPVIDINSQNKVAFPAASTPLQHPEDVIEVRGSESDFEYQLPASPKYFIGRKQITNSLKGKISKAPCIIVLNAQSGWGKSSLALMVKNSTVKSKGCALVLDSRTASHYSYVSSALRKAALKAQDEKLLKLPEDTSWASLSSALSTIARAEWKPKSGTLLIFFDQFENVFSDERLTREFRDLAFRVREINKPIALGFSWKTDLVGWTENHPYRLRDEIRSLAHVELLPPLGPSEVDILLKRLQEGLEEKLLPDLRQRLREYSQGLPWLFKKLAGHVLREVNRGITKSELVSEALNVQNLFDSDLAELQPAEQEGLREIARYAPIPISDAMDKVPAAVVQSLLDRRLIVQVGERLDTYWDTFRDFLVTGRVPIEDSFILRILPNSVGRLVKVVIERGGDVSVGEISEIMSNSEKSIYNLARELRSFNLLVHAPNRVKIIREVIDSSDQEAEFRRRVASSLSRHRAYSTLTGLVHSQGQVRSCTVANFAASLPQDFPAVAASPSSWATYARAFLLWFEYAGLVRLQGAEVFLTDESDAPTVKILNNASGRRNIVSASPRFPTKAPGVAINVLRNAQLNGEYKLANKEESKAARDLDILGLIERKGGVVKLKSATILTPDGQVIPERLREVISELPGVELALRILEDNPGADSHSVGSILRKAQNPNWSDSTASLIGKHFRGWAKACGVKTSRKTVPFVGDPLF